MERVAFVPDDRGAVTVLVDGQPQSHVCLTDPGLLAFEYVQHLGIVVDALAPAAPAPLAVTHVGGAGMTLARYVESTRPGSPQIVLEPDAALTEAVRRELPLPRRHRIRVRPVDGRTGVHALAAASADLVVLDAFADGAVPEELTSIEALTDVMRVLRPGGVLAVNAVDEPDRRWLARLLATLIASSPARDPHTGQRPGAQAAPHTPSPGLALALLETSDVAKGRRFGNHVVVASRAPLPLGAMTRAVARSPFPTSMRHGVAVTRLARGARVLTDADPAPSPTAPDPGRWRVR